MGVTVKDESNQNILNVHHRMREGRFTYIGAKKINRKLKGGKALAMEF